MHTDLSLIDNYSFYCSGQMSGYYNPYAGSFSAAHMAAAAAAAAAQQSGQVSQVIFCLDIFCAHFFVELFSLILTRNVTDFNFVKVMYSFLCNGPPSLL